ncbi:Initiation-specific alpha-1,6-mannosyltransferase [Madurella mycetomatis]|uniref:Initiation-specific alpha-1,6-mannosyltransferase n=1 Tax=Madurella mycetomatis TaxID=100816 RepID=A0A175VY90_9PEZI|nr:Initiation-specific alpha-1,6-mannosyltransferase [Madurella mycetomatis]
MIFKFTLFQFLLPGSASPATLGISRPPAAEIPIPRQIWQIFFPPPGSRVIDKRILFSNEWIAMSPGYTYTLVSEHEAAAFIDANFDSRPEIAETYHALKNPALKSDFLRYLLLLARGGIYTDVDTRPIVPLEDWLPADKRRDIRLIIAPEYDESQDPPPQDWMHPVQFCQWTIAAAPNHPILARMVNRTMETLHYVAQQQGTTLDKADFSDFNVLNSTGPVVWSEVVLESIKEMNLNITGFSDFYGVHEQRYYQDVVVMPHESFRGDVLDEWGIGWRKNRRALVRHFYKGGWRKIPLD